MVLIIIELTLMSASFYLFFVGVAAILVGLLAAAVPGLPDWSTIPLFGVTSIALMVGFRQKFYQAMLSRQQSYPTTMVGERLRMSEEVTAGGCARVEYRGASWSVENVGPLPLAEGDWAEVQAVRGTTLLLGPVEGREHAEEGETK